MLRFHRAWATMANATIGCFLHDCLDSNSLNAKNFRFGPARNLILDGRWYMLAIKSLYFAHTPQLLIHSRAEFEFFYPFR